MASKNDKYLKHYTIYFTEAHIPTNYFCLIEYHTQYSELFISDPHHIANILLQNPYSGSIFLPDPTRPSKWVNNGPSNFKVLIIFE